MAKGVFPINKFQQLQTPFYYYDTELLRKTLQAINTEAAKHEGFVVHYAVKANANPQILRTIRQAGLGADAPVFLQQRLFMPVSARATGKSISVSTTTYSASMSKAFPNWRLSTNWQPKGARRPVWLSVSTPTSVPILMPTSLQDWLRISLVLPCATC